MKWILVSGTVALAAALLLMTGLWPAVIRVASYVLWVAGFALLISLIRFVVRGR